jgi:hypothetical protein
MTCKKKKKNADKTRNEKFIDSVREFLGLQPLPLEK